MRPSLFLFLFHPSSFSLLFAFISSPHPPFHLHNSRTTYIVDTANRLSITCAGKISEESPRPPPQTWDEGMKRLADFLESVRQRYRATFGKKHEDHRRGPYTTVPIGPTRGSGSKVCVLYTPPVALY